VKWLFHRYTHCIKTIPTPLIRWPVSATIYLKRPMCGWMFIAY